MSMRYIHTGFRRQLEPDSRIPFDVALCSGFRQSVLCRGCCRAANASRQGCAIAIDFMEKHSRYNRLSPGSDVRREGGPARRSRWATGQLDMRLRDPDPASRATFPSVQVFAPLLLNSRASAPPGAFAILTMSEGGFRPPRFKHYCESAEHQSHGAESPKSPLNQARDARCG